LDGIILDLCYTVKYCELPRPKGTGNSKHQLKRVEDKRFITGQGRSTDDIVLPQMTYAHFVRSPHAHAEIRSVVPQELNNP